jgi:hypothetical protein
MQAAVRVGGLSVVVALGLLVASGAAEAARKPISGKLSRSGYTVIALAADGRATSVVAKRGRFRVKPRGERVTMQLRAPDGVYAGPVVLRGHGRRAIVGVREGARLGRIAVRAGYARPARPIASRWVDATRSARARRGVPIGARVFGRVRSKPTRIRVPGDRDRDGVPNPLDVDDDGDLILDTFDRGRRARASQGAPGELVNAGLALELHVTVNANAAALTTEHVDAALARDGILKLNTQAENWPPGAMVELDCGRPQARTDPSLGGLVYCSRGGTGAVSRPPYDYPPFPGDPFGPFDPDGDGFGTLQPDPNLDNAMVLRHGATTAQIGTGDVLIFRVTAGGVESESTAVVEYVFATVPALVSYDDGRGNATTISYPVAAPAPGTHTELPVAAGPNGDVIAKLTFWRPQRRPIAGEACLSNTPPCEWIDIGRLGYAAAVETASDWGSCPQNAFSTRDPNLAKRPYTGDEPADPAIGGLTDLAPDQPANPANTFTYTLNLTRCLAASGLSFNPGETRRFHFAGGTVGSGADQAIAFKRR